MRLFGKETRDLNQDDIDRLYQNKVVESRVLDYKLTLPKPNDEGKKELLADITAMANTDGGLLIFGIKEAQEEGHNTGYPGEIIGITGPEGAELNIEQLKQWLDSVIRDGIEPRLSSIEFHEISYNDKVLFIISILRSLQSPHMVKFGGDSKFYARSNTGKYQMDVRQIREAFSLTDQWRSSAENFRKTRLASYIETSPGIPDSEATLLFHVIPLGERDLMDLKGKAQEVTSILPSTIGVTGWSPGYNLDGIIKRFGGNLGYVQVFRNGGLEALELLNFQEKDSEGRWQFFLDHITNFCMKHLHYYLKFAEHYHIDAPFVVYINIINMSGAYVRTGMGGNTPFANGRDKVLLPGIYIDDISIDINQVLRSSFDIIYQSCGSPKCPSYTPDGIFTGDYLGD